MAFEAIVNDQGNDHVVILQHKETGSYVEVFAFGALLNKFCLQHNNETVNVIDGFESAAMAKSNLKPLFNGAKLSPFVCRLKNGKYHFDDHSFQVAKNDNGKHAIHGLIYDAVYSIIETEATADYASVKLQHVYDNDAEGYPFCYRCEVVYTLKPNNELIVTTTITNIDEQRIPVSDGWHPYFTLGDPVDDCQLEFQSREKVLFDDELIPTGKLEPYHEFTAIKNFGSTTFDNCFTLNFATCQPMCVFRNPAKKLQIEIHPSKEYPFLQIFTPGHRKSMAIENLSTAPDAFNNGMGLTILEPHESASYLTKYIIKQL